jgi:hypothetical protein
MKSEFKRIPEVAASRAEMAEMYRSVRYDNPALARLLYQRVQAAQAEYNKQFHEIVESRGGLAALVANG